MHGAVALVRNGRREVAQVAADAGELKGRCIFLACTGTRRVVDRVVHVGERGAAVDDAIKGIRALNAGTEADGLEERLRSGAERVDRRPAQRVREAALLEGVA